MKISVIMPSYLGYYDGCANNREEKLIRAINSFLANKYENKELIIISDCCDITNDIVMNNFNNEIDKRTIKIFKFNKKQKVFSGYLRSKGLELASGDYIIYLDSDDMFGDNHISSVVSGIKSCKSDWGYFNDYIYADKGLMPKNTELKKDSIGTSSIFHKNIPKKINWDKCHGYGHDFKFVERLIKYSKNYSKIYGTSYIICHIPNLIDK